MEISDASGVLGGESSLGDTPEVVDRTRSSVSLEWDDSQWAEHYRVYVGEDPEDKDPAVHEVDEASATVSELEPETDYWFQVVPEGVDRANTNYHRPF